MIVESGVLPDHPGGSLAPDALSTPDCMPAADHETTANATAAAQHGRQPAEGPKAAGADTANATAPPMLEQANAAVHDELQDLLQ